ncbi:MAG TPA: DUF1614 domain-containing protein [Gaiellaceae bacterium]|nr:DUF1614 domain-containing protein [Gaiellaceae bacterium]
MNRSPRAAWPIVALLAFVLLVLWLLLFLDVISFAYERLGLSERDALLLLFGSLVGSRIDLPVARMEGEPTVTQRVVTVFGIRYLVPVQEGGDTTIAVNVGGALIPSGFSFWLLAHGHLWRDGLIAALVVAVFVHLIARPTPGVGIVVPAILPPLVAAGVALALTHAHAAPVAYVSGTLGTLVGADLSNLHRIRGLGAPVASIGGAGTFDAVFLSGVMAVVLAAVL